MKILTYHYDSSTYINTYSTNFVSFIHMNTTIRYWFNDSPKCKYMALPTYQKALDCIELLSTIGVKAEVKVY